MVLLHGFACACVCVYIYVCVWFIVRERVCVLYHSVLNKTTEYHFKQIEIIELNRRPVSQTVDEMIEIWALRLWRLIRIT